MITIDPFMSIKQITDIMGPMIWERLLAAVNGKTVILPKTLVHRSFDWILPSGNLPQDSYLADLLGTTTPVGSRSNIGVRFWTRRYPYEINSLIDVPNIPIAIMEQLAPLKARFIYNTLSNPGEDVHNLKIFEWTGQTWIPSTAIDPTIITKLGPPQPGDYVLSLWKTWLETIDFLSRIFIKKPINFDVPYIPLSTRLTRRYPQEINSLNFEVQYANFAQGSTYLSPNENGKIYKRGNPDVLTDVGPTILTKEGTPQLGDYFLPELILDALFLLKEMKYTEEFPDSNGAVHVDYWHNEDQFGMIDRQNEILPYDSRIDGQHSSQVIENGQNAGEFEQAISNTGGATGSRYNEHRIYGTGKWFINRTSLVPVTHTDHVLLKTQGNVTHNVIGSTTWKEMLNIKVSGLDISPVPEPHSDDPIIRLEILGRGYAEWTFENE